MPDPNPDVVAQQAHLGNDDDDDGWEEFIPPELAHNSESPSSANEVGIDESIHMIGHSGSLTLPHTLTGNDNDHSLLNTLPFRTRRLPSPSSLMKAIVKVSGPRGKLSLKEDHGNGKRKSLLSGRLPFGRISSSTCRHSRPLSLPASPSISEVRSNPMHELPMERAHQLRTIQTESAPVPADSPCQNTSASTGTPRTEAVLTNAYSDGPSAGASPTSSAINVVVPGTSAPPLTSSPPTIIMSDFPTPASKARPARSPFVHAPSHSMPLPRARMSPARDTPSPTLPRPDLGERFSWVSDVHLPHTNFPAGSGVQTSSACGLGASVPGLPSASLPLRMWFRCTHAQGLNLAAAVTTTILRRMKGRTGTAIDAGESPVPSLLIAVLGCSTILERVLRYLTWAEFSALANANHVLRRLFDIDFDYPKPCRGDRIERKVREVVLERYVPGCGPSRMSGPPLVRRECEEDETEEADENGEGDIRVSMIDLDMLSEYYFVFLSYLKADILPYFSSHPQVQSQQIPLTVYPTRALASLCPPPLDSGSSGAQTPPNLRWPVSRPTSLAFSTPGDSMLHTFCGSNGEGMHDSSEVTPELARFAMTHSKFVAFLRHRAIRNRMHLGRVENANDEFDWRGLCAPIHSQLPPANAVLRGAMRKGLPPGVVAYGAGTGVGAGGLELTFPAPLSYTEGAQSAVPSRDAREMGTKFRGKVMTDPEPTLPSSSRLPSSPPGTSKQLPPLPISSLPRPPDAHPPTTITQRLKTTLTHLSGSKPHAPLPPPKPTQDPNVAWHRASRHHRHLRSTVGSNAGDSRMNIPPSCYYGHCSSNVVSEWAELGYTPGRGYMSGHRRSSSMPSKSAAGVQVAKVAGVGVGSRWDAGGEPSNYMSEAAANLSHSSFDFHSASATAPELGSHHLSARERTAAQAGTLPLDHPSTTDGSDNGGDWDNKPFYSHVSVPNNPHSLQAACNPYFAPAYRVYVPTSTFDSATIAKCEVQLQAAGIWERWIRVGDLVANLGYVPMSSSWGSGDPISSTSSTASASQEVDEPSWMVYDGRGLVRFDQGNPPLPSSLMIARQTSPTLAKNHVGITATATLMDDAVTAGIPCPTYYNHILHKGTNPIWPLSIPVHLLPSPPSPMSYCSDTTAAATRSSNAALYWEISGAVCFSLVQVAKYVPSHLGPVRVQRFAWAARCDFSRPRDDLGQQQPRVNDKTELGLWAGEWILEAEGTPEGRTALERVLEDSYRFGYACRGASVWKWEVVLERCEGNILWLRCVISSPLCNVQLIS